MFEQNLSNTMKSIFDFTKVTYDEPSDAHEQECIFLEIEKSNVSVKDGLACYRVTGNAKVYAPQEKLPFGYFLKKIKTADIADTKDLFFFNIEESGKVYRNIVVRSFSFIYFYSGQHDPDVGTINVLTTEMVTE